jgi:hypothetical protein
VSLRYRTTGAAERTVHPHILFRTADGTVCLDVYQVAGATSSGERPPCWRQLDLGKISAFDPLGGTFSVAAGFNRQAPKYAGGVLASV